MRERTAGAAGVGALALATFVFVTAETLPIGLLGQVAAAVRVPESAVGLLVTGYAAVVVVATIPLTRLTRSVPRKRLLLVLLGLFVVSTGASALMGAYLGLLATRLVTALAQALFWAVVTPAAAALVPPRVRGRAVSIVFAGGALAPVLGVPAGTWIGQAAGWPVAVLLLAALGAVALIGVAVLLPARPPADAGSAGRGTDPDRIRFAAVVVVTGAAVTGAFAAFTFLTPFLTQVAGFPASADGPLLLARGAAGLVGVLLVGLVVDRAPWATSVAVIALQLAALAAQWVLRADQVGVAVAVTGAGLALSALSGVNGARILRVAPGSTASASAAVSTAFNVGIMLGALVGSLAVDRSGPAAAPLLGAGLTGVALAVLAVEPVLVGRRLRRRAA